MATCEQTVSSEAEYDYNCTPCTQREQIIEAKKFCVECGEYFCSTCLSYHDRFGATKGHTLIDCHEVSTGHVVTDLTKCKIHVNKEEDMVCGEHDVVCCRVCIAISHKACKDIDYLPQAAQSFRDGEQLSELGSEVKTKIEQLQTSCREHRNRAVQLKVRQKTLLTRLHLFKISMTELIENLVTEAETDIENTYEPEVCSTQKHIQDTDKLLSKLNSLSDELDSEIDPVILYKKALECKQILKETQILQPVLDQKKLTENNEALTRIVETVEKSMKDNRFYGTIKIAEHDTVCEIPNMCLLPDGSLCLAHFYGRKVVHIDNNLRIIDNFDAECKIWGICAINDTKIAFTMPFLKRVQFLAYDRIFVSESSFSTKIHCRGIAYCNKTIYVTGGGNQGEESGQIHIFDLKGDLLRTIEDYPNGKPRSVIANAGYIFVTDCMTGVICMDLHGKRKWTFENSKCKYPWGICFSQNANLMVAGRDSNNIVLVSKDGEFLGELLNEDDGIKTPKAISVDIPNGRLLVSSLKSTVLKVIELDDCGV